MRGFLITALLLASLTTMAQQSENTSALDALKMEKDPVKLQTMLAKLGTGTEQDLLTALQFYVPDKVKMDSIVQIMMKRFPKSEMAFTKASIDLIRERSGSKKEEMLNLIKVNFPDKDLDQLYLSVASVFGAQKAMSKAAEYLRQIKSPTLRATGIMLIGEPGMNMICLQWSGWLNQRLSSLQKRAIGLVPMELLLFLQ